MLNGIKVIAMVVSFAGLCGLLKRRFGLNGATVPLAACCGIIVLLLLGGMAGALDAVWWLTFAGGLAGFVWCYPVKRTKVDWPMAAVLAAALIYGCWRYRDAYITSRDTVSHWAMVVKYMLREHRLPDDSTRLIYFQSYPLGSASFIYYAARLFGPGEPAYIVAQMMLNVCAFLPVFGLIRQNRVFGWTVALGMLAFLLTYNVAVTSLQVDSLLPFLTIGGMAALASSRDNPREAMPAVLSVIVVLPFIKNSGMLFAALLAGLLTAAVRANRDRFKKGAAIRTALLCAALILAAFGIWALHAMLAYPGVTMTKHAVSLQYYIGTVSEKSTSLIRTVAVGMVRRLLHPVRITRRLMLLAALALAGCWLSIRGSGDLRAVWMKRLWRAVVGCVCLYAVWYALLFFMYIFSMTPKEARTLASISRYEKTIIACVCGVVTIFVLDWFCRPGGGKNGRDRAVMGVLALGVALLVALGGGGLRSGALAELARRPQRRPALFEPVLAIEDRYDVEPEKSYLVFTRHDAFPLHTALYTVKYEFYSNDIMLIAGGIDTEPYDYDGYYTFQNTYAHYTEIERVDDLAGVLNACAGNYDYVLVCVEDSEFEAALAAYTGDTPVLRAW